MSQPSRSRAVLLFRPQPKDLLQRIREAAKQSGKVFFGPHARLRLKQRDISDLEALKVLRIGEIKGEIEQGRALGEWKCKIVAPIRGNREVGVVTIAMRKACSS